MKTKSTIEPLESRIAPATLTGQVLSYTDIDGDKVAVTVSKVALSKGQFTFDTTFLDGDTTTPQQLQFIDLDLGGIFDAKGANISTKVTQAGNGDGLVNIGYISAHGDLGNVTIHGDLGRISTYGAVSDPGVKSLSVGSIGLYGTATQQGGGNLQSSMGNGVGSIKVTGDVQDVSIVITGKLGSLTLGGSLIGGSADNSGYIKADEFGAVKIGRDMVGGDGQKSGTLESTGGIGSLSVSGSIRGGSGAVSGSVSLKTTLGQAKIKGDLVGGDGGSSGAMIASTNFGGVAAMPSITIGGSIVGGFGTSSGSISSSAGPADSATIGTVKIGHDVIGGEGSSSAQIYAKTAIAAVTISGSLIGGAGMASGQISGEFPMIGAVNIGHDVVGGSGDQSGRIVTPNTIASVTLGGSMTGGHGNDSGNIVATGDVGPVKIAGNVVGGFGASSGQIFAGDVLTSVTIGGGLTGGNGTSSGSITGGLDNGLMGDTFALGPVKIGGGVLGGKGNDSARIASDGPLTSFTAGGSVAGVGPGSGQVISGGELGAVKIAGDLRGASIFDHDANVSFTGYIQGQRIASVFIGGSIVAGIDSSDMGSIGLSASIRAEDDIGAIVVKGGIFGSVTPDGTSLVTISARGQASATTTDLAIKSLTVGGRVERANILAGYDTALAPMNANAQIGPVKVGGNWVASNLIAGVSNDAGTPSAADDNINFGDGNDDFIGGATSSIAKIASITIKGIVAGTPGSVSNTDHFGFVSTQIGFFKAAGFVAKLTPGTEVPIELSLNTDDVTIHEV